MAITQGDWKAMPWVTDDWRWTIRFGEDRELVCDIVYQKDDAILMAASKELLEACEDSLLTFNCFVRPSKSVVGEDNCECAGCEVARKVRAAIAKAKGGA